MKNILFFLCLYAGYAKSQTKVQVQDSVKKYREIVNVFWLEKMPPHSDTAQYKQVIYYFNHLDIYNSKIDSIEMAEFYIDQEKNKKIIELKYDVKLP